MNTEGLRNEELWCPLRGRDIMRRKAQFMPQGNSRAFGAIHFIIQPRPYTRSRLPLGGKVAAQPTDEGAMTARLP